jgi:hypothetical protein
MTTNNNHQDDNTLNSMKIENDKNNKELIRNSLQKMVGSALDEETREATMRIEEERQKAVKILVEENRSAIKALVQEGEKIIWMRAQAGLTSDTFQTDYIEHVIEHIYSMMATPGNVMAAEMPAHEVSTNSTNATKIESVELEILPPRDHNAIEAIHGYLTSIPQVSAVELITMVDKSIFRVTTKENVDFLGKLQSLPQVLEVKPMRDNGQEHIQITLMAKSKLVKSQEEMDAKVKKIFRGKN